jgi:hypothetical protein
MVPEVPCGPQISSESRQWHVNLWEFFLHSVRGGHWRKSTSKMKEFLCAFGTTLELVSYFLEAPNIYTFISPQKSNLKNWKTNGACTERTDLILQAFQKISNSP